MCVVSDKTEGYDKGIKQDKTPDLSLAQLCLEGCSI